jgi:hypothetical protein
VLLKDKNLIYVNIVLFISLLVIIALGIFLLPKRPAPVTVKKAVTVPPAESIVTEGYDISKLRGEEASEQAGKETKDLAGMYANFPESDVGENMPEIWSKVSPEQKKSFNDVLEKQIEIAKALLKLNPEDRKARNMLLISEMLKEMAANGFNHPIKKK